MAIAYGGTADDWLASRIAGRRLRFYTASTPTAETEFTAFYSDEALTVPVTAVVTTAGGYWPRVYVADSTPDLWGGESRNGAVPSQVALVPDRTDVGLTQAQVDARADLRAAAAVAPVDTRLGAVEDALPALVTDAEVTAAIEAERTAERALQGATFATQAALSAKLDTTAAGITYATKAELAEVGPGYTVTDDAGVAVPVTEIVFLGPGVSVVNGVLYIGTALSTGVPIDADTFTKAASTTTLGSSAGGVAWQVGPTYAWGVGGSQTAYVVTTTPTGTALAWLPVTPDNYEAAATLTTAPTAGEQASGVMARYADASNYAYVDISTSGAVRVVKRVAGTTTVLFTSATGVGVNGTRLALAASGSTFTAKVNGSTIHTFTEAALATGEPGLRVAVGTSGGGNPARFDDFEVVTV